MPVLNTNCCICGGGPAGLMLGYLLARGGVEVIVLEKHADFFRDFRGDTVHPSTLEIMHELGLLDSFLDLPHQEIETLSGVFNGTELPVADFRHLKIAKPVIALMPQWDFLNFIAGEAAKHPSFKLVREAKVNGLVSEDGRVTDIKAATPDGELIVRANLVVGADGRSSDVRRFADLKVRKTGAPIDVLWFRLSRAKDDPAQTLGRMQDGRLMVLLNRDSYWQCALVIMKGDFEVIKSRGLDGFYKEVTHISPFLAERVHELSSWDDIKLLNVEIDHLEKWYAPGILCIGDAAHAMSPVGGVGINLAIQDAVATANILYPYLFKDGPVPVDVLAQVQRRRAFPARMIQRLQVAIQKGMVSIRSNPQQHRRPPLLFRIFRAIPWLRRIPAKLLGMGIRREHVRQEIRFPRTQNSGML